MLIIKVFHLEMLVMNNIILCTVQLITTQTGKHEVAGLNLSHSTFFSNFLKNFTDFNGNTKCTGSKNRPLSPSSPMSMLMVHPSLLLNHLRHCILNHANRKQVSVSPLHTLVPLIITFFPKTSGVHLIQHLCPLQLPV